MKKILLLLSVLLSQFTTPASAHERCSYVQRVAQSMAAIVDERRPFDVLSYQLDLDLRPAFEQDQPVFTGIQEIRLKITEATNEIVIDAGMMTIDEVTINGTSVTVPALDNEQLTLTNGTGWQKDEELTIRLRYTRDWQLNRGAYFFPQGTLDPLDGGTVEEDIFYTQSEPFDAHRWMPCVDLPYDKAASAISITVPSEYTGISNGLLETVTDNFDGSRTFQWRSDKEMSTYLMVANASKYVEWEDDYVRVSDPTDTVRCLYYAWEEDLDGTGVLGLNAELAFEPTPDILREFSLKFGEYPFEQYGQVPVYPYGFGGMEHQSMTTVHRRWLDGESEDGIAHEIGHQWFGDKTTCETWDDLWLNEGFATFTEAVWSEAKYGYGGYFGTIFWQSVRYLYYGNPNQSIHAVPIETAFGQNSPIVYSKASLVLHMLRRLVNNDTLFFNAIRDYSDAFAYKTANTRQFRDFMSDRLDIDLTRFFDQWIFGSAHPYYEITWDQEEPSNDLIVQVRQQGTKFFETPMRFFVEYADASRDTLAVMNNATKQQRFVFDLTLPIANVTLDSDWSVLSINEMMRDASLGVDPEAVTALRHYRDGASLVVDVSSVSDARHASLVDILGREVVATQVEGSTIARLNIRGLPAGAYFLLVQGRSGVVKQKVMLSE